MDMKRVAHAEGCILRRAAQATTNTGHNWLRRASGGEVTVSNIDGE